MPKVSLAHMNYGHKEQLSFYDIKLANIEYKCIGKFS